MQSNRNVKFHRLLARKTEKKTPFWHIHLGIKKFHWSVFVESEYSKTGYRMNSITLKISFRFLMCCQLNHSGGFKSVHVMIPCNIMKNRLRILFEMSIFCFVLVVWFIPH